LYTATHPLDAETRKTLESALPITIGDDCWIGGNSVICPSITIGKGVIGAGSVVTKISLTIP
jgi:maltose O-acetyltransferase